MKSRCNGLDVKINIIKPMHAPIRNDMHAPYSGIPKRFIPKTSVIANEDLGGTKQKFA